MNSKTLVILAGVTGALVLGAVVVTSTGLGGSASRASTKATDEPSNTQPLYPGLTDNLSKVARVVIEKEAARVALVRDAGGANWSVETKGGYPADFDNVRPIVAAIAEAKIEEAKTAKPELHSRLDLEEPSGAGAKSYKITLQDEDGKDVASLIIGKSDATVSDPFSATAGDGKPRRFVRRSGENQTYLALMDVTPNTDGLSFINRNAAEIKAERVRAVTIERTAVEGGAAQTLHMARTGPADAFTVRDQPVGRALKDEGAALRVAQSLGYVSFDDVKPVSEVNFDAPGAVKGTFELFDGINVSYVLVDIDGVTWARLGSTFTPQSLPATPSPAPAAQPAPQASAEQPAANAAADISQPVAMPDSPAPTTPAQPVTPGLTLADQEALNAAAKKESDSLNNRWGKWAFAIPSFKVTQLKSTMEDLLAPPAAEAIPESGMQPPASPASPASPSGIPAAPVQQPGPLAPE